LRGLHRLLGIPMLRALGTDARRFAFLRFAFLRLHGSSFAGILGGSFPGGSLSRLLGSSLLLRRCVCYWCAFGWCIFDIACQISLTPRPVKAENGSGSACWRIAFKP